MFQTQLINATFEATNQEDLADMEAAKWRALKGALEVGTEQVLGGESVFAAEVIVADGSDQQRFIVTISTSPLK